MKTAFCPLHKHLATGGGWDNFSEGNSYVLEAVRQLPGAVALMGQAVDKLGQYLLPNCAAKDDTRCRACVEANRPQPFFKLVSVDYTDPSGARVKLYTRIKCHAFACVRDAVTLGGRLADEATLEGLRRLRSVWHLLMNDPACEHDDEYARPVTVDSLIQGLDLNWELSRLDPPGHSRGKGLRARVHVPCQRQRGAQ